MVRRLRGKLAGLIIVSVLELQGGLTTPTRLDRSDTSDTMRALAPDVKVIQRPTVDSRYGNRYSSKRTYPKSFVDQDLYGF